MRLRRWAKVRSYKAMFEEEEFDSKMDGES